MAPKKSRKLNIVLLTEVALNHPKEATNITLLGLAKEYKSLGHNVHILARATKNKPKRETIDGIKVTRLDPFIFLRFISPALWMYNKNVDVVHNFGAAPIHGLKNYLIKKVSPNIKNIFTLKSYSKNNLLRFSFLGLLSKLDGVTVPTQVFRKKIEEVPNVTVVHTNLDTKKFKPKNKAALKKKYGFQGKKVIFYYGALYEEKGPQYLVEAIPKISSKVKNALFIFAPRHPFHQEYMELKEDIERHDNAAIFDKNINILDYVNLADVVALPYKNMIGTEGNPSCMLESAACKTPVVVGRQPEIAELFEDKKEIIMFRPEDVDDLSNKICSVLSKSNKKLVDSAYKKSSMFATRKIAKKYLKLYER